MEMSGNTILITGGGSGIGRGLAEAFHRLGNQVIISGRRKAALDEVIAANPGMCAYTLDVDDPQSIADFTARMVTDHPDLNILVNNAGIMHRQELTPDNLDLAIAEATITTNILGPVRMIAALLPHLRRQKHAAIVNVTSGLATVPIAASPSYCASKAAIHSYTVSLRHMLKDSGIEVIELVPPGVRTGLTPGQAGFEAYMPLDDFIAEVMDLFAQKPTPAEICVERVSFLRNAERENRFDQTVEQLNAMAG